MTCEDVQLELEAYVRGVLEPGLEARVREHLQSCAACREAEGWVRPLAEKLLAARPAEPPVDVDAITKGVFERAEGAWAAPPKVRRSRSGAQRARQGAGAGRWIPIGAGLLVLAGLALWLQTPPEAPGPSPSPSVSEPAPSPTASPVRPTPRPPPSPSPEPSVVEPSRSPSLEPSLVEPSPRPLPFPSASPAPSEEPSETPGPGSIVQGPEPTPTPKPGTQARVAGTCVAVVVRLGGEGARVRSPGAKWEKLARDRVLGAGDELDLRRGAVEVLLTESATPTAVEAGTRVAFAPGAQATLGPLNSPALVEVKEGACFVRAALKPVNLVAGACFVTMLPGAIAFEVDRRGGAKVEVHEGRAVLKGPGGETSLEVGQAGEHSAKGKRSRVRRHGSKQPRWLTRLHALDPSRVLFEESFAGDVASRYEEFEREEGSLRFGRSTPRGGLCRYLPGAKIRVRVRLSEPSELAIQLTNLTQKENFRSRSPRLKSGVWTVIELNPERFADAGGAGKVVAGQDLLGYLTLSVTKGRLEVAEVVAYRPGK